MKKGIFVDDDIERGLLCLRCFAVGSLPRACLISAKSRGFSNDEGSELCAWIFLFFALQGTQGPGQTG